MVKEAVFYSGLSKISTTYNNQLQEAFRPNAMYSYIQSDFIHPDFVVDITDFFDVKMKSILAYASQFYNPNNEEEQEETFISTPEFLKLIESKDRIFGKSIGVTFAEGFKVERYIGVNSLFDLF
jgi:LmbE family N-acetylglucosaminyl deacetylase